MIRTKQDAELHSDFRVVCAKKTGRHRFHVYQRPSREDAELCLDILSKAHWTVDCRPYRLERRTVMPWEEV